MKSILPKFVILTYLLVFLSLNFAYNQEKLESSFNGNITQSVDPTTLDNKLMVEYRGWFTAPEDGSALEWRRWFRNNAPASTNAQFDFWPDLSEFDMEEKFPTGLSAFNGNSLFLYSNYHSGTVNRHCGWMAEYNIDGFFLNRLTTDLLNPGTTEFANKVLQNMVDGCETYGRVFAIRYNIAEHSDETLYQTIVQDWKYLIDELGITQNPQYLHHNGLPVVSIHGIGFATNDIDPEEYPAESQTILDIVEFFQNNPLPRYRATIHGGVPTYWRTQGPDSRKGPIWATIYRRLDVISPWLVGRFGDEPTSLQELNELIQMDLNEINEIEKEYCPTVWPGFSKSHLTAGRSEPNQVPRNGGSFYWRQVNFMRNAGVTMALNATFDDVNTATAISKLAPTARENPTDPDPHGPFLVLNTDGYEMPSDFYLNLAKKAALVFREEKETTPEIPGLPKILSISFRPDSIAHSITLIQNEGDTVWIYLKGLNLFTGGGYKITGLNRYVLPSVSSSTEEVKLPLEIINLGVGAHGFRVKTYNLKSDSLIVNISGAFGPSSLVGKFLLGYRGSFSSPGDGSLLGWDPWFRSGQAHPQNARFDLWPDMSEYDPDEKFDTGLSAPAGNPLFLYSNYISKTVDRHCKWMADYNLDGVFLTRPTRELMIPEKKQFCNQVLKNLRVGLEKYERILALRYDITAHPNESLYQTITEDWKYLIDELRITESPQYLHDNDLPVLVIHGPGFWKDTPASPETISDILDFFQNNPLEQYRAYIVGGVPAHWRTLDGDSRSDPVWAEIYARLDAIFPWYTARFNTIENIDSYYEFTILPDIAEARRLGIHYLLNIFPGFSPANQQSDPNWKNWIPREGGQFYWRQVYRASTAGVKTIFNANFDDVIEGTAMFKLAPTEEEIPDSTKSSVFFLPLNADGYEIPSDFYLSLAKKARAVFKNVTGTMIEIPGLPEISSVSFFSGNITHELDVDKSQVREVRIYVNGERLFTTGGYKLVELGRYPQPLPESTANQAVLALPVEEMDDGIYRFRVRTYNINSDTLTLNIQGGKKDVPGKFELEHLYPNPSYSNFSIPLAVDQPGKIVMMVYDILGRRIDGEEYVAPEAGRYLVSANSSPLSSGIYFVQALQNGKQSVKKIIVLNGVQLQQEHPELPGERNVLRNMIRK